MGAQAIAMGTRFLASDEAAIAPEYKACVVRAIAADTVHTRLFNVGWSDAPHRVLRNATVRRWEEAGSPAPGNRPGEGAIVARVPIAGTLVPVPRYSPVPPLRGFE